MCCECLAILLVSIYKAYDILEHAKIKKAKARWPNAPQTKSEKENSLRLRRQEKSRFYTPLSLGRKQTERIIGDVVVASGRPHTHQKRQRQQQQQQQLLEQQLRGQAEGSSAGRNAS